MHRTWRLLFLLCFLAVCFPAAALAAAPETSAQSAILIDAQSGRVLYEKNPNEERLIASITKLMTALVAAESHPNLSETVTIRPEWTGAEGSSLYLKPGETLKLETLLYGLLLHSGNDAAVAIAGYCAGDVETFVSWMNQRAADLGMKSTHFENPNGLNHEAHYSTAADMAKLASACLKSETVSKIAGTKTISLEGRSFRNHNKLLWQVEGCVGMKTGYTQMAGRTLVSAATREGQSLIVVTLSDPDDWKDHKNLYDYGFAAYPLYTYYEGGQIIGHIPVEGSLHRSLPVYVNETIAYPQGAEEVGEVKVYLPDVAQAPIQKGDIAGKIEVSLEGKLIGRSYLRYAASAGREALSKTSSLERMLEVFEAGRRGDFIEAFLNQKPGG